jgi:hypothetical protein
MTEIESQTFFELMRMRGPVLELVSFDVDGTLLRGRILNHLRIPQESRDKIAALHSYSIWEDLGMRRLFELNSLF